VGGKLHKKLLLKKKDMVNRKGVREISKVLRGKKISTETTKVKGNDKGKGVQGTSRKQKKNKGPGSDRTLSLGPCF